MSTYIEAIIPVDGDKYRSMRKVRDACEQADITLPSVVQEFFYDKYGECRTTELGRVVDIPHAATSGDIEYGEGKIIDLTKLPEGVTKLRIYMDS